MEISQEVAESYSPWGRTLEEDRDYWKASSESYRAEADEFLVEVQTLERLLDHANVRIRTLQQALNARD